MSKRYLRRGPGQVAMIYPGTLLGLTDAMKDAQDASAKADGAHTVSLHDPVDGPSPHSVLRVFANGALQVSVDTEGEDDA